MQACMGQMLPSSDGPLIISSNIRHQKGKNHGGLILSVHFYHSKYHGGPYSGPNPFFLHSENFLNEISTKTCFLDILTKPKADKLITSYIRTKLIHTTKFDPLKLYKTSKKSQLLRFLKYQVGHICPSGSQRQPFAYNIIFLQQQISTTLTYSKGNMYDKNQ